MLVPQILRPSLVLLGSLTKLPTKKCQGLPKTVWVELGKSCRCKRLLEDAPDRVRVAPVLAVQAHRPEPQIVALRNLGCREQRIIQPPQFFGPQIGYPIGHDRPDVVAHREECSDK